MKGSTLDCIHTRQSDARVFNGAAAFMACRLGFFGRIVVAGLPNTRAEGLDISRPVLGLKDVSKVV